MTEVRGELAAAPSPSMGWLQGLIRFALEIALLVGLGYWRYSLSDTTLVRLLAAIAWSVFRTPGDNSAGKEGIVPVPGWVRLLLELGLLLLAAYVTWSAGSRVAAETLLTFTALHYLLTWQRIRWLLTGRD